MAEILSPGVFIEEVPSAVQVVQPVSTSNMGIIGATQRGPTDEATLVTSFEQFTRIFGPLIPESRLPLSMAAYFANGGRRAFVVRVMPDDAVEADGSVTSARYDFQSNVGDGTTATVDEATLSPTTLPSPIVNESGTAGVTFRWRANGVAVSGEAMKTRDDSGTVAIVNGTVLYEARIDPASLPTDQDLALPSVMPGETMSITWDPDGVTPVTMTLTQVGSTLTATGTTSEGSTATLDLVTGFLSLATAGADQPGTGATGTLDIDYTPGTAVLSVSDDGAGTLVNDGTTLTADGTITYNGTADPTYSFTAAAGNEPGSGCPVLVDFEIRAWNLDPISVGDWANDMKLDFSGNADFFTASTNQFSRFNVNVLLLNESTGNFDIVETFEELTFTDSASAQYFPDVINDLSDLVRVVEPALNEEAPTQLSGRSQSQVVAGGDEDAGNRSISTTLDLDEGAIKPRTVSVTYTDSGGTARSISDDGAGNLTGDVDPSGTNTINYTTGALELTVSDAIGSDQLVSVDWWTVAAETEALREGFTGGDNGTFTDPNQYGRSQFTDAATLEPNFQGLYALNRVEELMQVVIPDFVGDTLITKDLMDYADGRETQPSGGDRFVILAVPQGSSAQEAVDFLRVDLAQNSKFAALYWPWVRVADPLSNNRPISFPPVAHIAGVYARTDSNRNVGKAPGGTVDGALRFLLGLETEPTQGERDFVYPNRINPLISSPQTGLAVWGVRTTSLQSEWRYINARRLFMFVEKSIFNATHWIVFENNGAALWARIKAQIQGFLTSLFNDGLFAGTTPAEAFFVIVDSSNNTPDSINQGQVIIDVGIAPNRPAEFVRFRFQQKTLDA